MTLSSHKHIKPLIALVGPTASGKTQIGIELAKILHAQIVSADSRQVYKYLTIGTAKPTKEEQHGIIHHFIDILEPDKEYSAGQYGNEARHCIQSLCEKGIQPIIVGGSGLYIRAVIDGLFQTGEKNVEIRKQLQAELEEHGKEWLYKQLQRVDPEAAATMDATKVRRVIRALEVFYTTGKPISFHHKIQQTQSIPVLQVAFEWKRHELYQRINQRVEVMLQKGLLDEVLDLKRKGFDTTINALNTVGYKEAFEYLDGIITYEKMKEKIQQNTRRFAKRQLTWFRADKRIKWIELDSQTDIVKLANAIADLFQQWKVN